MAGYKAPTFQERTAAAAKAREKALTALKAKPAPDPAELARRAAEREAREAAKADKRAAAQAAKDAERAEAEARRAEQLAVAVAAKPAPQKPEPTDAERKAARDAKYAARKRRKASR